MRTTCDLQDSTMIAVQKRALEEHRSIKDVLNEVIANGLSRPRALKAQKWLCPEHDLGSAGIDYMKAWDALDSMEIESVAEKLRLRK